MALMGSSPLGLVFDSRQTNEVGVGEYKRGSIKNDEKLIKSIFKNTAFDVDTNGNSESFITHNDDIYDTSIMSILEHSNKYPAMKLLPSDFAYLKNFGVYPNNRLMIARRYASPVADDLTMYKDNAPVPLSTLISWLPDGENFMELSYGENWIDVKEGNFIEVLNNIGSDLTTTGIGSIAGRGMDVIPMPGVTEGLQYEVMKRMGITEGDIPSGNPNLVREAKMRSTISDGETGSGVKAKFQVKMIVEYEQKFINGIDPTLVYYDIIANALSFGTSDSYFQFNGLFDSKAKEFMNNLISGDVTRIKEGLKTFVVAIVESMGIIIKNIVNTLNEIVTGGEDDSKSRGDLIKEALTQSLAHTEGKVIHKYRNRIVGIVNAITGSNSTPWHIMIGNPKRPTISSGDMVVTNVDLTLGNILSFNDLPSSVKIEYTLTNARNLGASELFKKMNNGRGRTYRRLNLSFSESGKFVKADSDESLRFDDNVGYVYKRDDSDELEGENGNNIDNTDLDQDNFINNNLSNDIVNSNLDELGSLDIDNNLEDISNGNITNSDLNNSNSNDRDYYYQWEIVFNDGETYNGTDADYDKVMGDIDKASERNGGVILSKEIFKIYRQS